MAVEATNTETVVPGNGETVVPNPVSLKDDDLIEVEVGGEKKSLPWKEARSGIMMHQDYTRKTQSVSEQAKELKSLYEALTAKQKELVEKETAIDSILGRTKPNEKKSGLDALADDEVVSGAQIKGLLSELLEQHSAALTKTLTEKFQKETQQGEQARQFQRWEEKVEEVSDRLIHENPILKRVPQLSLVLKRQALEDKPTSEKEMVAALVKAGKELAKGLDEEVTTRIKEKATRKEELVKKGPQAPGGTQTFDTFTKPADKYMRGNRSVNFDKVEQDVLAALEALDE